MPLRSSGCYTCRKRKIRCDQGRPGCKRCVTHGVPCPGYRDDGPAQSPWRDQTLEVVAKALRQGNSRGKVSAAEAAAHARVLYLGPGLMADVSKQAIALLNPVPRDLFSPILQRKQLHGTFLDVYLPKSRSNDAPALDHNCFFQALLAKDSSEPALQQSLDALSLVALGSLRQDPRLLHQAVHSYGLALSSLAKALAKPETAGTDDTLAAATVMGSCSLYDEIGKTDNSWGKHVTGLQQLIAAKGPQNLNSTLALLLFSNTRHGALIWSLIKREAPYMALPAWRALAFSAPIQDSSTLLYDAALQIPGLLQKYDKLGGEIALSAENIREILTECAVIELQMRDWWVKWLFNTSMTGGTLYEERPIDEFPTFTAAVKDRTFATAYWFDNFPISYLASIYWMCFYQLRSTTQSLHAILRELDKDWFPEPGTAVSEEELLTYIQNLCKTIPFFTEPVCSCTGHVGIFLPMRTAAIYFMRQSRWAELKWIGTVRASIFTKGLSPPVLQGVPNEKKGSDVLALWRYEKLHPFKSPRVTPDHDGICEEDRSRSTSVTPIPLGGLGTLPVRF